MNNEEEEYYGPPRQYNCRCHYVDFPPVPCDAAIWQLTKLLVADGPDSFRFLGYQPDFLKVVWTIIFGDGELREAVVAPCELAEVIASCKYFDEIPPVVAWKKDLQNYVVTRRGGL
jgi:hypothetical protein